MPKELWFDSRHQGAFRILDRSTCTIIGYDPREPYWSVSFTYPVSHNKSVINVDFHSKKTHHGRKRLTATFSHRNTRLQWSDGNMWYRISNGHAMFTFVNQHFFSSHA